MKSLAAWVVVALVLAGFVELGMRAFDHEWEIQAKRNQALREAAEER
jgi:hypothetical protein